MMQTLEARFMRVFVATSLALLFSAAVLSQDETPAPQTDEAEVTEPVQPDQEVEVNEDNYRQFMELKDGLRQRTVAPQDSFESRSGLQKLDQLPEASQKHLRNQLREIISQNDRWQPGDENTEYPYVPSEAARTNAGLQKQEAEAWGELLDNYHAREAQIYANSARSRAAMAGSATAMGSENAKSAGQGENRAGQGQQGSDKSASQPGSEAGSFAPGAQGGAGAQKPEGVAQNAMEFLQKAGYQGDSASADASQQQAGDSGQMAGQAQQGAQQAAAQASAQSQSQSQSVNPGMQGASQSHESDGSEQNAMQYLQQLGQQDDAGESNDQQAGDSGQMAGQTQQDAQQAAAQASAQSPSTQANSPSQTTDGTEQNAMEFLQQMGQQPDNADESSEQQAGDGSETNSESPQDVMDATVSQSLTTGTENTRSDADDPEGVSQNALEYLAGEGASEGDTPTDTLSLEDLLNAQGVTIGADALQQNPDEAPKDPPD